ncbi:MAG: hypothetical protein WAK31_23520 [Chthoniobacterales bacterium]
MFKESRFSRYIKTRQGGFSLFLVIACGLMLAFFCIVTFYDLPQNLYRLNFGKAKWIQATVPSQHNFFRKTLYLPAAVDRAWIQVAATDNYTIYVNNQQVGTRTFYSTCVARLYDLKKVLKPGKNVIAIEVDRYSFPGSGQLLVRGFYGLVGSPVQEFVSDPTDQSWRASSTPDGILNGYVWSAVLLDDSFWKLAEIAPASERFPVIESVPIDPKQYERRPTAKWIAPLNGSPRQASFSYEWQAPNDRLETWIQIAATGNYDLIVNGRLITTEIATTGTGPVQVAVVQPTLLAYNITRWMRDGTNSITIRVSSQTLQPALLLVDGYTVLGTARLQRFESDATWKTRLFSPDAQPAVVVAQYGDQPWGTLEQTIALPSVTPVYDVQKVTTWGPVAVGVLAATLVLWILASVLVAPLVRQPVEKLWTCDALFHLCVLILMLFLWLLTFDVRFQNNWCFKPRIAEGLIFLLAAGKLLLLLPRSKPRSAEAETAAAAPSLRPPRASWVRTYWKALVLVCIVLLGFSLRVRQLTTMSLDVDEFGVIQFSHGVQKKGYPFIQLGSFEKEVTTYELVSYSISVARQFLGESESAYRTAALIYSTITIALIGIVGIRMMGWRVGLTASLIFATFPTGIFWGHNAFWPSQEQMFSLATFWCFYEGIKNRGAHLRAGFITAASVCFILAYLTWEGSGFILPTLFACIFAMQWARYEWMKNWHLWRCCVVMSFAVGMQLAHRQVASLPAYMQTGISLSDVTTPVPVWFDVTHYDPQYYLNYCLFAENYVLMTLFVIFGIAFCWKDRALRYLFLSIVLMLMWYTEFLPAYAVRYSYDYQSLLILAAVGIMFKLCDRIVRQGASVLRWGAAAAVFTIFVLSTNGFILHIYRLSRSAPTPYYGERMGIYRTDYRGAAQYVVQHFEPGDGLIVAIPHIFEFYTGMNVDYSINTMLDKKITYSGALEIPHFLDKFRGYPCIRSLEELEDLRSRFKRLWIVQVPLGPADNQNPPVIQYLARNAKVVYLSYKAEVDLLVATPNVAQQIQTQ